MKITLGSNIASLKGQRQLAKTSGELATVFERLSSGQRINKASDDAAGLAIADSLNANSRIFNQGVRNLNDGLSLLNIADAAIENLSSIMIRLEELAEQAANGVYGSKQRKALDAEAQALSKEFFRISKSTEFNGQKLLSGDFDAINLQGGVGVNAVLSAGVGGAIGTGSFAPRVSYSVGSNPSSITTADFNGDGILDLATADYTTSTTSILLGLGNGSFAPKVSYALGTNPISITGGDFNGDGVWDLASTDSFSSTTSILLGRGDGGFAPRVAYSLGTSPYSITTGDFNGDGILDLVSAELVGTASILLGYGDGRFAPRASVTLGAVPYSITTGDFNSDGILDLASADSGADTSVLLGRGDGTFGPRVTYDVGSTPRSIASADLNGDGILDLVTANNGSNTASVLIGLGNGTFATSVAYALGSGPRSVSIGDFNGDGFLDLASSELTSNSGSVLLNRGDGTFAPRVSYALGSTPRYITSGDFNGDGVLDLVSTDYGGASNAISILLGETKDGIHPLLPFSLKTIADARQAMPILKRKREQLAAQRGEIGAFQSRIDVAVNVLYSASENFKAAESRIRDADIAAESSQLVRTQILQQAASAVLAQANQQPALVLQLLG